MWLWAALVAFGTVVVSLYTGPLMWISLAAAVVTIVSLTFLLPIVHKPHLQPHRGRLNSQSGGYWPRGRSDGRSDSWGGGGFRPVRTLC